MPPLEIRGILPTFNTQESPRIDQAQALLVAGLATYLHYFATIQTDTALSNDGRDAKLRGHRLVLKDVFDAGQKTCDAGVNMLTGNQARNEADLATQGKNLLGADHFAAAREIRDYLTDQDPKQLEALFLSGNPGLVTLQTFYAVNTSPTVMIRSRVLGGSPYEGLVQSIRERFAPASVVAFAEAETVNVEMQANLGFAKSAVVNLEGAVLRRAGNNASVSVPEWLLPETITLLAKAGANSNFNPPWRSEAM